MLIGMQEGAGKFQATLVGIKKMQNFTHMQKKVSVLFLVSLRCKQPSGPPVTQSYSLTMTYLYCKIETNIELGLRDINESHVEQMKAKKKKKDFTLKPDVMSHECHLNIQKDEAKEWRVQGQPEITKILYQVRTILYT